MKYIKVRIGKKKKKQDYLNGEFRRLREDIQKQPLTMIKEFIEKFPCKSEKYLLNLQVYPNKNTTRRYQITSGMVTTEFGHRNNFNYSPFYKNTYYTGHPPIWSLALPNVDIKYESTQELQYR